MLSVLKALYSTYKIIQPIKWIKAVSLTGLYLALFCKYLMLQGDKKLQIKNLMSAENFFPLNMAGSKFEKYCPRQSHFSAWIAAETLSSLKSFEQKPNTA